MKKLPILGVGHGGINPHTGRYVTFPNKCAYHDGLTLHDGGWFYEGVFNRMVLMEVVKILDGWNIPFETTLNKRYPWFDRSLAHKVNQVNKLSQDFDTMYMEIHSNYFPGNAHGIEVYTSPGKTSSDVIAERFYKYASEMTSARMRPDLSDDDYDKEARFYVLMQTICPAILTEWRYFSNREEASLMVTPEEVLLAAKVHALTIRDWWGQPQDKCTTYVG